MCGIAGIFEERGGNAWGENDRAGLLRSRISAMLEVQHHRGPDDRGIYLAPNGATALGHNRLSILDLSPAGRQPMENADGRLQIVFNGEIYNYRELRRELDGYPFRSLTDTEVILAAYERWGADCLEKFIGMFAFLLWDKQEQRLFSARDRFGIKPLYYALHGGQLIAASEIKALHAAGVPRTPNVKVWANYLVDGVSDTTNETFWDNVIALGPGESLTWRRGQIRISRWYDLAARVGQEYDNRPAATALEEYRALLSHSVELRFRSDVPVGVNLSGGLDSSVLLATIDSLKLDNSKITAFTFVTGDSRYDELPWVENMLAATEHPSRVCALGAADVPELAASIQEAVDEPYGGLPTLAYAALFAQARKEGAIVLLDGQGMDEQWAGYNYYADTDAGYTRVVQGAKDRAVRPECLSPELRAQAEPFETARIFPDTLRNLQYRDIRYTKIPRALRFNDRISMKSSTELREPFLDHRLVELAFRQPPERKICGKAQKWGLRQIAAQMIPEGIVEAPKRPLQTPQREWLRGPLRGWAEDRIEGSIRTDAGWLDGGSVRREWQQYLKGNSDNSFYVWQWISLSLCLSAKSDVVYV